MTPKKRPTKHAGGRPKTGRKTKVLSVSIPVKIVEAARKQADKNGESLSQLVTRSIHNLIIS